MTDVRKGYFNRRKRQYSWATYKKRYEEKDFKVGAAGRGSLSDGK